VDSADGKLQARSVGTSLRFLASLRDLAILNNAKAAIGQHIMARRCISTSVQHVLA
jgi:hypothetical protein